VTEVWVWATPRRRGKRRLRTSLVGGGNEGHGAPSAGVAVPVLSSLGLPKGEKGPPATEKLETWLNLELLGEASFLSHPGKSSLICLILFGCLYTPKLPFERGKPYFHWNPFRVWMAHLAVDGYYLPAKASSFHSCSLHFKALQLAHASLGH